jgi:hypothetical protein
MEEIDLVAEVLTGNRRHLWLKPYSTPRIMPEKLYNPVKVDSWPRYMDGRRLRRSSLTRLR